MARQILGTQHSAFAPVALRLIASGDHHLPLNELIDFAYKRAESADEVHARLVELVGHPDWDADFPVFNYWKLNQVALPSPCLRKLLTVPSVWTRAFTYATFPQECEAGWVQTLLRDLSEVHQPLPADRFAQLLRKLDDDDFAVRERATAELEKMGFRVEAQLRETLASQPSPEIRERAQRVLNKLARQESPPKCSEAVRFLGGTYTPESTAMLESLAKGPPDSWLTQEARELLQKRSQPAAKP